MYIHLIYYFCSSHTIQMIEIVRKEAQASGEFNGGEIIENKPIGFPQDGGTLSAYSNLFYWAHATSSVNSTIGLHPHRGFEIMSVVLKGSIQHYDSLIKKWIPLKKGDVQLIQAGRGLSHSEEIQKGAALFQIWFDPDLSKSLQQTPSYQDYPKESFPLIDGVKEIVGPNAPTTLNSDIVFTEHNLKKGDFSLQLSPNHYYSLYLYKGCMTWKGNTLKAHDFIRLLEEESFQGSATENCRLFCIKSPIKLPYRTFS